jgi:outer membrane biosynthesis protein TonB
MGVGSLTGNADLLTAPAKEPPPAPAGNRTQPALASPPSKSKTGLIVAILGAAVIIGGALFFMGGSEEGDPETAKPAVADTSAADEKTKKELAEKMAKLEAIEAELKKAKAEAEKKGPDEAEKKKEEELKKEKEEAEKKEAEEAAKKEASGTASASGTSTNTKSDSGKTPAASSGGGAKFDVGAARAALMAAAANAAACKTAGGPTGSGKVQATFSTSGRVTSATVISGPFGGTAVGGCVASTFRRARVPAFSGDPQTVAKSFTIN